MLVEEHVRDKAERQPDFFKKVGAGSNYLD
jgi:hypothetical protein